MNENEILAYGINISKIHLDFMMGTDDLDIVATLKDGSEIKIFCRYIFRKYRLDTSVSFFLL